jgi:hypothetical protein
MKRLVVNLLSMAMALAGAPARAGGDHSDHHMADDGSVMDAHMRMTEFRTATPADEAR